ncbi:MAG TPA: glycosyltransferase family 39 protein [Solirubrobacteraceae bacterium]|jgi:hypothetical protein
MSAAPSRSPAGTESHERSCAGRARERPGPGRDRRHWPVLAAILAGALALRVWGVAQGLPYVYNSDENDHFVPKAIHMFASGSLNPEYFANPPALTYLLHVLYLIWFGGAAAARHAYAANPTQVFVLARVAVALLGTAAVWLLYFVGARLFGRAVALLAAAIEAVAFLPVFYSHLALNDVPTLAPLTLSLLGTAGVLRRGRRRDYVLAGVGLGLGCATKYTAGIVVLPLLAAVVARWREIGASEEVGEPAGALARGGAGARAARAQVVNGVLLAGALAAVSFLIANPYALLDLHRFRADLSHQSQLSGEAQGKLGAGHEGGVRYYLWSLTWGLGWLPALAALGGAVAIWRREVRLGWLLVPAPLLFLAFMGLQGRYFGRWLLPIFPIVCLLAAFGAISLATLAARAGGAVRLACIALAAVAMCGQGLVYAVHSDLVLSRADTRTLTRRWMVANIPVGSRIVAEPVSPDGWASDIGYFNPTVPEGARWSKYSSLRSVFAANGAFVGEQGPRVGVEDYERTLRPQLIPYYERQGYCWVISGFTQYGRAFAEPRAVPAAMAYYRALRRQARVVYSVSPYAAGARPVAFNFDWSFDYYPLAYRRPGPQMTVYRLRGGRCGR